MVEQFLNYAGGGRTGESFEPQKIPWALCKRGLRRARNYGMLDGFRTRFTATHRCCKHAAHRHSRCAVPVLQHRNGRSHRWKILKPYRDIDALLKAQSSVTQSNKDAAAVPAGMDPNLYQQRPPIDLTNPRLRKLAAALGPAYVRVSGTWANTAYFHNSDQPAPKTPPKGFGGVLTRLQWKGVIDFAHAVDAKLAHPSPQAWEPEIKPAPGLRTRHASFSPTPNPLAATSPPPNT